MSTAETRESPIDSGGALDKTGIPPTIVQDEPQTTKGKRGFQFWMCFASLILPTFLVALDITAVSTPLPVIVQQLNGREFEWVGSAYALSATALQPLCGGLAQVFGRRIVMLMQIFFFALGSVICGAAPTLNILILGRTIQGIGAGGIACLGQVILGDLVPLQERGAFNGLIAIAYAFATAIAPVVGGALARGNRWRWLFYLNLPICGVSAVIALVFLKLKTPHGTWQEKVNKLDWAGNFIVIGSTTSCVIALTWGGIVFPWDSPRVLIPLVIGIVGLVAFMVFEAFVPKNPLVPISIMKTRTSISGHVQTFFTMFLVISFIYYLPVYFQACRDASPIRSGVLSFGVAQTIVPFGMLSGISIAASGRYRPQLWFAWSMCVIGTALFSTLTADSTAPAYIGYQVIIGIGMGMLMTSTVFPVLSPLPVSLNANALAFYMFNRYLSQIWGVTAGGTVLQNELGRRLPAEFLSQLPGGVSIAYSAIPIIRDLPEPLKTSVRHAFADSLRVYWQVLIGVSGAGLVTSLLMKGLPLHTKVDENWGLHENKPKSEGQTA